MEKICWQIIVAAFMQPLQNDLRSPAAKDNSITHTAKAGSNLDAAITMWVAKHNRTTRNGVGNCSFKTGSRRQSEKKKILKHFLKGFLEGKSLAPKWRKKRISCETSFKTPSATHPPAPLAIPFTLRERSYSCKSQWNSVDRACTKNTWNPIYNAEPIRPWSDHDPRMIRPHTRPSRTRRTAEVDHRRSRTDFVWKNIGFRASAISQKRISCETSFKTASATPPPAPLAIPFTVRERSYRVANHNGIPSATHPPAPLAIPFTLRERSYSCKSQWWNSVDHKCTKHRWHPIYNAEPIREWSDHTRDRLAPVAPQR